MSKHKYKPTHAPSTPYLVQIALVPLSVENDVPLCIAEHHKQEGAPLATWEAWHYQDYPRVFALFKQGYTGPQVTDILWKEALQEQAKGRATIHYVMPLCDACAEHAIALHGGEEVAMVCMLPALLTRSMSILLVSHRQTEQAAVLTLTRPLLQRENVLDLLAQGQCIIPIHLKSHGARP